MITVIKEESLQFYYRRKVLGWEILIETIPQYNMKNVYEFYANISNMDWSVSLPTVQV